MDIAGEYKKAAQTATYIDEAGNKQTGTLAGNAGGAMAKAAKVTADAVANAYAEQAKNAVPAAPAVKPGGAQNAAAGTNAGVNAGTQNAGMTAGDAAGTEAAANEYTGAAPGTEGMSTADLYRKMYDESVNASAAQLKAANAEAERLAEEQRAAQAQQYQAANRQAYSDYLHSVKNLPEQLAAYGITGGLAESSRVKLDTNYSGGVQANAQAQAAGERDINSQLAAQRYQAQAAADAGNNAALQNYYQQMIAAQQQKEAEDKAKKEAAAETMAGIGDYSGYVELGLLTPEQAAQMQKVWIKKNPKLAKTLGYVTGSGKKGSYDPKQLDPPDDTGGQVADEWRGGETVKVPFETYIQADKEGRETMDQAVKNGGMVIEWPKANQSAGNRPY